MLDLARFLVCIFGVAFLCGFTSCYGDEEWNKELADKEYTDWMTNGSDKDPKNGNDVTAVLNSRAKANQDELIKLDPYSADVFKRTPGYLNFRGMIVSGRDVEIEGMVKVYGGVYAGGNLSLANGASIVEDVCFVEDMRRINENRFESERDLKKRHNGEKYEDFSKKKDNEKAKYQPMKPVNLESLPVRVKLLNLHEVMCPQNVDPAGDSWYSDGLPNSSNSSK